MLRGHYTSKEQNHSVQNEHYIGFTFKMWVKCTKISQQVHPTPILYASVPRYWSKCALENMLQHSQAQCTLYYLNSQYKRILCLKVLNAQILTVLKYLFSPTEHILLALLSNCRSNTGFSLYWVSITHKHFTSLYQFS